MLCLCCACLVPELRSDSSKTYSIVSLLHKLRVRKLTNYKSQDSLRAVTTNSISVVVQCFLGDVVS